MLTKTQVAEIEARAENATQQTWESEGLLVVASGRGIVCQCILPQNGGTFDAMSNSHFISASHTDVPALCATVRELREELRHVHAMLSEAGPDIDIRDAFVKYDWKQDRAQKVKEIEEMLK